MLDRDGYRPNVGIVLINARNEVFWGKRIREHAWQFPQGGIKRGESPEQAMFRELHEEVGLRPEHVRVIGRTREWLRYEVPEHWIRREFRGHYRGQKQIWFLIRLIGRDTDIDLRASGHPEFDAWRWSQFWVPLEAVIEFKREVYRLALIELSRMLPRAGSARSGPHRHPEAPRFLRGMRRRPHGGGQHGTAAPAAAASPVAVSPAEAPAVAAPSPVPSAALPVLEDPVARASVEPGRNPPAIAARAPDGGKP